MNCQGIIKSNFYYTIRMFPAMGICAEMCWVLLIQPKIINLNLRVKLMTMSMLNGKGSIIIKRLIVSILLIIMFLHRWEDFSQNLFTFIFHRLSIKQLLFLSCRPFVVITLSTGLVSVEVTSVSWLGQLTIGV